MLIRLFAFLLTILSAGCTLGQTTGNPNAYSSILTEKEKAAAEKQTDHLGDLITTISFNVRTDNLKDFEDGLIPWASIENPERDIPKLVDSESIIIPENKITIIIDYPLTNAHRFELESKSGFSREQLLREVSKEYYRIYETEENSATTKTVPIYKRTTVYNRNQTDGKFGIWGHDIADLVLSEVLVYKASDGQIVLSLNIES